ncbi:hypothetical protein Tsubulata_048990 [Turnera subulata]|uniref:Uncharacterized protein n=1 Tax=Turnera subulata TaxID=218843 RepID=A0A9Q0J446_9ROSI|nr:hypothetical protein Tsubulata_048990 [Turnera subulata]
MLRAYKPLPCFCSASHADDASPGSPPFAAVERCASSRPLLLRAACRSPSPPDTSSADAPTTHDRRSNSHEAGPPRVAPLPPSPRRLARRHLVAAAALQVKVSIREEDDPDTGRGSRV